jgi:tetratricopeptide (TPR) repeat protein
MSKAKIAFDLYLTLHSNLMGIKPMLRKSLIYGGAIAIAAFGWGAAAFADDAALCKASDPYRNGEATYTVCNRVIQNATKADLVKAEALAQRGEAYYWVGQFQTAISDFDAALAIAPELNETRMQRGWARIQTGDIQSAYRDFTDALDRNPKSGRAVFALAFLARDRDVARKGYEQALALTPDYYLAEGNIAGLDEDLPETRDVALKRYNRILALGKKKLNTVRFYSFGGSYFTKDYYNSVLHSRAILLYEMELFDDALKDYRELQTLSKAEPLPFIGEAKTLFALKDYVGAASVAEKALEICKKSSRIFLCGRATEVLVKANLRLGKNDAVVKHKDEVNNHHWEDYSRGMIALSLAQAYKSQGKLIEARVAFQKVGELYPELLGLISDPMNRLGYYDGTWDKFAEERFWNGIDACLLDTKCVVNI